MESIGQQARVSVKDDGRSNDGGSPSHAST